MNPLAVLATVFIATTGAPQERRAEPLDSLVRWAVEHNPRLVAARERIRAAEARVAPAGTLPDPVLSLSVRNFPVSDPGFDDFMTMKSVALSQRFSYPGKRTLAEEAARQGVVAAVAVLEDLRLEVVRGVRSAYYELAFLDRAMEVVARHSEVMSGLLSATNTRYSVGTAGQTDVLRAQVETAALADEASRLTESRRGVLAELNHLLDRPVVTTATGFEIPEWLVSAAVRPPSRVSFVSLDLGARVADSPLRPLEELLATVAVENPTIALHRARIDAQRARVALAQRAHLPDLDIALSYGQRDGRSDMLSLSVALPLPFNRGARQNAWSTEAAAELAALEAEHRSHVNTLRAKVSELHADLERDRSRLALLTAGMLPQGNAALQAATAGFQVAGTDFLTVLTSQATLFQYETSFYRTLADFAKNLAELERVVGSEVLL